MKNLTSLTAALLREVGFVSTGDGTDPTSFNQVPTQNFHEVIRCINQAFQTLWLQVPAKARMAYTHERWELVTLPGESQYPLPDWIQSVGEPIYPIEDPGYVLSRVRGVYEIHNYQRLYAEKCDPDLAENANHRPVVFHIDTLTGATRPNPSEGSKKSIWLAPAPILAERWTMEVERECPKFEACDLLKEGDSIALPIPHEYVESLLFPIARYFIAQTLYFDDRRMDRMPIFQAEYEQALSSAGASSNHK